MSNQLHPPPCPAVTPVTPVRLFRDAARDPMLPVRCVSAGESPRSECRWPVSVPDERSWLGGARRAGGYEVDIYDMVMETIFLGGKVHGKVYPNMS